MSKTTRQPTDISLFWGVPAVVSGLTIAESINTNSDEILWSPTFLAKTVTILGLIAGLIDTVGPSFSLEKIYGLTASENNNAVTQFLWGTCGTATLSYFAMLYAMIFEGASVDTASRVLYALWACQATGNVATGWAARTVGNDNSQAILFFFCLVGVVGLGLPSNLSTMTNSILIAIQFLGGMQLILTPHTTVSVFQPKRNTRVTDKRNGRSTIEVDPVQSSMIQYLGYFLVASSGFMGAQVFGRVPLLHAVGCGSAVFGIFFWWQLLSLGFNVLQAGCSGSALSSVYFWLLFLDGGFKAIKQVAALPLLFWGMLHLATVVATLFGN